MYEWKVRKKKKMKVEISTYRTWSNVILAEELRGVLRETLSFPQYLITATIKNIERIISSDSVVYANEKKCSLLVGAVNVSHSLGSKPSEVS